MEMMKVWRDKRVLFGFLLVLIGGGTVFMWQLASRTGGRTDARQTQIKDSPDHELKELGVQLQKKPGHTPILMRIAQLEHDQGKLADAAGHLREVVTNEPNNADAHLELGRVLYEKGDWAAGLAETQKALAINPKQVDAMYNLGAMYANGGDTERARSLWRNAVNVDPQSDSGKQARQALAKLAQVAGGKR